MYIVILQMYYIMIQKGKIIMINEVYAIYDDASECYVQFLNCQNEKIARMTFEKLFKEKRLQVPMLYDYPNTYSVYLIANFDDNTGLFENISPNKLLLNFGTLVQAGSAGSVSA